ncbi:amidohydrolase family protein [Nocardia sp. NEAU-G5]|uniref:Amidohydrolase family protein n=1 Tax=Nocardia albiluteola TaxID=2842303 RepID=A0ABS6BEU1_9NOCA|nr:amidohydrolase family protein [Nocardia albiluteola]MBU3068021.1 amidohydrolase family protein [Nocardia albiluteola]
MTIRIDAHHHLWDLTIRDQPWITGAALAPLRRNFGLPELVPQVTAHGITATVVVQTVSDEQETIDLLALAADAGPIAAVVGWTDLTSPDIADRLATLRERPTGAYLRGIRHQAQDEPDPRWLCRADVRRGLRAVAEAGLVYELLVTPAQLPAAVETVAAVPECRFVLDHLAKPAVTAGLVEPWASDLARLAVLPNTVCKLSGLVTEADWVTWTVRDLRPYADRALSLFGPERILFGSDWPVCTLAADYGRVVQATEELTMGLTATERAAVFGGNAIRTYQLNQPESYMQ